MVQIQYSEYLDKVRGCWAGKNIGGTLGAPMEGNMAMNDVTFYTQELNGVPAPNDDLDLQLIWLAAVEIHGLDAITPRLLGEYWDHSVIAPCSEYAVCKMNINNGVMPPLSGAINNERYKYGNGAWIRSEIWACLCPGAPDEAIKYAYIDSCADHCEEGIWAEMFTAALQSAAFVENDIRKLIEIALSKIPADSKLAAAVKLVIDSYDGGKPWNETRELLVHDFEPIYRAAVNIGFMIIGLLYGEGDFDKSICRAVNCGDDTDCTAATVGALFGIIKGRKGIPQRWLDPIGETISTICINHFGYGFLYGLPKTLEALSQRTARAAIAAAAANPFIVRITDTPTNIPNNFSDSLIGTEVAQRLLSRPLYYMDYALPYAALRVEYVNGPEVLPNSELKLNIQVGDCVHVNTIVRFRWRNLPETWGAMPMAAEFAVRADCFNTVQMSINVGEFDDTMAYLELEVSLPTRRVPEVIFIPVQHKGTVNLNRGSETERSYRCRTRIVAGQVNEIIENATPQL